jgi:hypothetical protein
VCFFFVIIKKGLSQQYAQEKLLQDGPNALKPMKGEPEWKKFLGKLFGGFHLLLLFGAFLCMAAFFMEYSTSDQPSYDNVYLSAALVGMRCCNSLNATIFFLFCFVFLYAVVVIDHFDHIGYRNYHFCLLSRKAEQQHYGFLQRHDSTGKRDLLLYQSLVMN